MDPRHTEVLRRRLHTQHLQGNGLRRAADVVRVLTGVQSQEHAHAFWSLGLRTGAAPDAALTSSAVQREFDDGAFVRTHILRPTWHFVAAEDLHCILRVTSPRIQRLNAGMYRQEGLDAAALDRATTVIIAELRGRRFRTRAELAEVLAADGLPGHGFGLAYAVMNAELEGEICSGPMRGASHTYALAEERVPVGGPNLSREDGLAELARRFFAGHGPAELKDLTRWASLTLAEARAGWEQVRPELASVEVDGRPLYFVENSDGPRSPVPQWRALLVPLYDELTLTYPGVTFPVADGHPHRPGMDLSIGSVICAEVNVGLWKRTVAGRRVTVATPCAPGLSRGQEADVAEAVQALARFLELDLVRG